MHFFCFAIPNNPFHQHAFNIALVVGCVSAILQPLSGDLLAKRVAELQPLKLAVFEGQVHTQQGAPFRLGGLWNLEKESFDYVLEIPYALSLMIHLDPQGEVKGFKDFAKENWPPIGVVRTAFQIMVFIGFLMMFLALWAAWLTFKNQNVYQCKSLSAGDGLSHSSRIFSDRIWLGRDGSRQATLGRGGFCKDGGSGHSHARADCSTDDFRCAV